MSGRRAKRSNKRNRVYRVMTSPSERQYKLVRVSRNENARPSVMLNPR